MQVDLLMLYRTCLTHLAQRLFVFELLTFFTPNLMGMPFGFLMGILLLGKTKTNALQATFFARFSFNSNSGCVSVWLQAFCFSSKSDSKWRILRPFWIFKIKSYTCIYKDNMHLSSEWICESFRCAILYKTAP